MKRHTPHRRCGSSLLLAALLATSALTPSIALAANDTWTGAVDTNWQNAGNWSNGVPTASDDVIINSNANTNNPYPFISTVSPTIHSMLVDRAVSPVGGSIITGSQTLTVTTTLAIGSFGSTPSAMTVDGHLVVNGATTLSSPGKGYLSIRNGGSAQLSDVLVGEAITGSTDEGYLFVIGATLSANNVSVGDSAVGHFRMSNAGTATVASLEIGSQAGSLGDALVDGSGTHLDVTTNLNVGQNGHGSLTVQNGGSVATMGLSVGVMSGAVGDVNVTGTGSSIDARGAIIGGSGTGTLQVAAGATATIHGALDVGRTGGDGTVTVTGTGSNLTAGASGSLGAITFGLSAGGTGRLNVTAGGVADFSNASLTTFGVAAASGNNSAGVGMLSVDGAGSKMIAADTIIGDAGQGTASVTNGGQIQLGNGTLTLGNQVNGSGTLVVDGANSQVSAGAVVIAKPGGGTAIVTLSNGGTLTASTLVLGQYGNLIIGAAVGHPAVAPGVLTVGSITSGLNSHAEILLNHTGVVDISASMSGSHTIGQASGLSRLSGDGSGFAGQVNVVGGVLIVDSNYGMGTFTATGGTLGGVGTLGALDLQTGATLDPGAINNGIGTLHANGPVTFGAGSTYKVDVNAAGQSDRLTVANAVTINGGQVAVVAAAGNYAPSTQYTILTGTGVTGTFTGVSSNFAFLTPTLSYDPTHVYLTLTTAAGPGPGPGPGGGGGNVFLLAAQTPNEIAAANGVASLGAGNPVYNGLLVQSVSWAPAALDQLSGDAHATFGARAIAETSYVRDGLNDRIRAAFESFGGAMAYEPGPGSARPALAPYAFWFQGFGGFGQRMSDWNAGDEHASIGGGIGGVDGAVAIADQLWRFGIAGSYASSSSTVASRNAHASIDTSSLALYGGTQFGALGLRFGTSVSFNGFDTRRVVQFPGFADVATARYDARTYQVFGEAGYRYRLGSFGIEPFAGLTYVGFDRGAFAENGGAAALTAAGRLSTVTLTTLGARASHRWGATLVEGSLAWRHGFGDVGAPTTLSFVGGGTPFTVLGVQARDIALVSTGVRTEFNAAVSAGVAYQGQFGSSTTGQGLRADVSVRF